MQGPASTARAISPSCTRGRIVQAATDLFIAQGYRATSLRDVASAAGITHQGLRRHFDNRAELLGEVVRATDRVADDGSAADDTQMLADVVRIIASSNERKPGWIRLWAAVSGEGAATSHPLHTAMTARYIKHHDDVVAVVRRSQECGAVSRARDADAATVRLAASWDGFQLLSLYLADDITVVDAMGEEVRRLATDPPPMSNWAETHTQLPAPNAAARAHGFGAGQERRDNILISAIDLFSSHGYGDTSMAQIATQAGVTKATLYHHYASKDQLARAVLTHSQHILDAATANAGHARATARLHAAAIRAEGLATLEPILIRLHTVLCAEATPDEHPLHEAIRDQLDAVVSDFESAFLAASREGHLREGIDPRAEAIRLVALWEGLQVQWSYDESVPLARHLREHIDELFTRD